jgi:hypothetical protein
MVEDDSTPDPLATPALRKDGHPLGNPPDEESGDSEPNKTDDPEAESEAQGEGEGVGSEPEPTDDTE